MSLGQGLLLEPGSMPLHRSDDAYDGGHARWMRWRYATP